MKKIFILILITVFANCKSTKEEENFTKASETTKYNSDVDIKQFIPKGYILNNINDENYIKGDLNNDGKEDIVFLVKNTDKSKIIEHESRGILDRNRRGIIILFNERDSYKIAAKNLNCFTSEFEDGGVYYDSELLLYIENGKLNIHYAAGRYGYNTYQFKYQNNDFNLVEFIENSSNGPVTDTHLLYDFVKMNKIVKINTNENAKDETEEVFDIKSYKLNITKPFNLIDIIDFETFKSQLLEL